MKPPVKIAVVGLWHQGVVGAACLADWGYEVVGIDQNQETLKALSQGSAEVFEPGLNDLLVAGIRSGRLHFTHSPEIALKRASYLWVMHDTPVDEKDRSNLSVVFDDVLRVLPFLEAGVLIHITAQIPVGTCDKLRALIKSHRPELNFDIVYSPENLRLGQAIERFKNPPLPVLGGENPEAFEALEKLYAPSGVQWQRCSVRTAEMLKHALNAFLATSISFGNELGNLCDQLGADGHRLASLLKLEPRVGSKAMLSPGLGFAGGTLARDMQTLRDFGDHLGIETPLLDGVWDANADQNNLVKRSLLQYFGGSLAGKKVCVLGLTYKPDTSTLRRSAALELIEALQSVGAEIQAHDPKADREELSGVGLKPSETPLDAAYGCDALVLMTPWRDYQPFDFHLLSQKMKGRLVFDTANLWDPLSVESAGLQYLNIGSGRLFKIKP